MREQIEANRQRALGLLAELRTKDSHSLNAVFFFRIPAHRVTSRSSTGVRIGQTAPFAPLRDATYAGLDVASIAHSNASVFFKICTVPLK